MENCILGYLVLRTPEENFDDLGRGAFLPYAPKIGGVYYGGVDRMQWFDVDEDYYNKSLSNELIKMRERIYCSSSHVSDLKLCESLKDAKILLDYSNKSRKRNELVAIFSDGNVTPMQLSEAKIDDNCIGCDLYSDGYGSLIKEGVFSHPGLFGEFTSELNRFGLFEPHDELIEQYINAYQKVSSEGSIERMEGFIKKILIYKIS